MERFSRTLICTTRRAISWFYSRKSRGMRSWFFEYNRCGSNSIRKAYKKLKKGLKMVGSWLPAPNFWSQPTKLLSGYGIVRIPKGISSFLLHKKVQTHSYTPYPDFRRSRPPWWATRCSANVFKYKRNLCRYVDAQERCHFCIDNNCLCSPIWSLV